MAQELLDWTFAEIPHDDAPTGTATIVSKIKAPARPPRALPRPGRWARRRAPRWARVVLLLAGLLAALGVTVQAVVQAGWRRIEQQVTDAVLYEDTQARAGQVDRVLAAQVPTDGAWLAHRKQEVLLGQPGPNPAPQLRLAPLPPEVTRLTATFANQVQATVVRTYADSAGRQYRFEFTQTYNSAQPGIWLRQPTDTRPLKATTTWTGARLAATYPLADQAWMSDTLPVIEAELETACAGWNCPPGLMAPLVFASSLPVAPGTLGQIVLLSPHLAGWPRDDEANQALRYSVTARALIFVAEQSARSERGLRENVALRDALLARAETWLGQPPGLDEALKAARL